MLSPKHSAAALAVTLSLIAHISWRRNVLVATTRQDGVVPPVVVVGGWSSAGTHMYELDTLNKLGSTLALGSYSEALLPFPGTCTLAAGSSLCCDGSVPPADFLARPAGGGMGFTAECAVECALRTATFLFSRPSASAPPGFVATATGAAPAHGQAPDSLAIHPAGKLLVGNFGGNPPGEVGGNAAILSWRSAGFVSARAASLVASTAMATPVLHPTSHIHYVATDETCGRDALVLIVDAGTFAIMASPVWAIHIVNPRTAAIEDTVHLPMRPRQITLHPTLPVAYVIYELSGKLGVWHWPRCSRWRRPFDVAATPATPGTAELPTRPRELQQLATTETGTGPGPSSSSRAGWGGPAAPTRIMLSPLADVLHVCGRNRPTGEIATYAVDAVEGTLSLVGFTKTVGTNPRECALSPGGEMLLEVDTDLGTLASYAVGASGALQRRLVVDGIEQANTLAVWTPPAQCYAPQE